MSLVAKAQNTLQEVSLLTWGIWSIGLFIYFLYGYFKLNDFKFSILSFLSSLNCATIFFMTLYKRIKYHPQKPSLYQNESPPFKKVEVFNV